MLFLFPSVVQGHHIYKETWTLRVKEIFHVQQEPGNKHDFKADCLLKSETIVGNGNNWD